MLRTNTEIETQGIESCHGGEGVVNARLMLKRGDSTMGLTYMHDDTLAPGVTIAEHRHEDSEEVFFVAEGNGIMILDGEEFPVQAGEVSLVSKYHTHGIKNTGGTTMRLIIVGVKQK